MLLKEKIARKTAQTISKRHNIKILEKIPKMSFFRENLIFLPSLVAQNFFDSCKIIITMSALIRRTFFILIISSYLQNFRLYLQS